MAKIQAKKSKPAKAAKKTAAKSKPVKSKAVAPKPKAAKAKAVVSKSKPVKSKTVVSKNKSAKSKAVVSKPKAVKTKAVVAKPKAAKVTAAVSKSKPVKATVVVSKPKVAKTTIIEKKKIEPKKGIKQNTKMASKKIVEKKIKEDLIQTDTSRTQAVIASIEEKLKKVHKSDDKIETAIERKLLALINLQLIDSQIDKIRIVRGELPLEVQDLEDEIMGIQTRIENYKNEAVAYEEAILEKKESIKQCSVLIKKYEAQLSNVRNNREYESLSKEVEFQNLEIQLSEKKIKEFKAALELKKETIENSEKLLAEKRSDLDLKNAELSDIVTETEKEESVLLEKSQENQKIIEDRLLTAYMKIRKNARNGLAVVMVERDACGGCFNKIPPQRQLDIRMHKKIIVCEYCGRILVDIEIADPS